MVYGWTFVEKFNSMHVYLFSAKYICTEPPIFLFKNDIFIQLQPMHCSFDSNIHSTSTQKFPLTPSHHPLISHLALPCRAHRATYEDDWGRVRADPDLQGLALFLSQGLFRNLEFIHANHCHATTHILINKQLILFWKS